MSILISLLHFAILLTILLSLAYFRAPLLLWLSSMAAVTVLGLFGHQHFLQPLWIMLLPLLVTLVLGFLSLVPLRRKLISKPLFGWFKGVLPTMSDTEREALEAGTVWWDAELFSGKPKWKKLLEVKKPELTDEEQAFMDGPVKTLCAMLDDWEIRQNNNLTEEIWDYLKKHRFFSMIIPKEYGGLDFSPFANSAVVMMVSSRNVTAAVTIMVPNSLGPGELLLHYGTDEQKNYYLPRLASSEDIPCFALTAPAAGSDASGMPDEGVVCMGEFEGKEVLGLSVTWDKRYITLAPVATVLGLAFRAVDPNGLLGSKEDLGITCALIPTSTPGVEIGARHIPVGSAFLNGPTRGNAVFIPMEWIIGGQARIGQGWRMLMQSLAAGRAISLPALGTAGGKSAAIFSGAYARIRRQFNMPIGYFEGIEEPLARIGGNAYRMDAARQLTLAALMEGEKPSVLSAILKQQLTDGNRLVINEAMDIHGGKGIIEGPNNYLASAYKATPVAITVEGANILTRSMIIFGQGAIRCHPWLLKEMESAADPDATQGLKDFDRALFGHVGFVISNKVRAFVLGVTSARWVRSPVQGPTARYYRQLTRMSAAFTFIADFVLATYGGSFKFKEKTSGRLADVLSHLYLASAVLKKFEDDGQPKEDMPLVHWAMQDSLYTMQTRLVGILRNYPLRYVGKLIRFVIFPLGLPYEGPRDTCGKHVARLLLTDNPSRDRLMEGLYISEKEDATGLLMLAFAADRKAVVPERALKNAFKQAVSITNYEDMIERGLETSIITQDQAELVRTAQSLAARVIAVDEFPADATPM
ncbi:MAG: acyl-CoA dehydrogenase [Proteobacteria bacterium]|nr:acyl-CoA dehydrogenase [Pseudomonadota bacterium]